MTNDPAPPHEEISLPNMNVRELLTLAIAFSSPIALAGFVVMNTYLGQYTTLRSFDIHAQHYLAAGLTLIMWYFISIGGVMIIEWVIRKNENIQKRHIILLFFRSVGALILAILTTALVSGFLVFVSTPKDFQADRLILFQIWILYVFSYALAYIFWLGLMPRFNRQPLFNLNNAVVYFIAVLGVMALSLLYGAFGYSRIPFYIGGGAPAEVNILFVDDTNPDRFLLPMETSLETQPLCLLAELTDGWLVYDPVKQQTYTIADDLILAFRDTRQNITCTPPR